MWCLADLSSPEIATPGSTIAVTSGPSHGIAWAILGSAGAGPYREWYYGYTPDYGYTGMDSISYYYHSTTPGYGDYYYTYTFDVGPNVAPTDITLSNNSVAENQAINTTVGTLSSTDANEANSFTYSLVGGDTGSFNISGDNLRTSASFDFESKSSYSVSVRSTDQGGAIFDKALTISVTNVNETPTDIALSNASVAENQAVNTVVGTLSTTDPDTGNTFTYTLVGGDSASFNISGSSLRTAASFDF